MSARLSKTHTMSKEEFLKIYSAATKSEQDALTRAAREWLKSNGITVGRDSLRHWRSNPTKRSPLAPKYLKAYQYAFQQIAKRAAAEH